MTRPSLGLIEEVVLENDKTYTAKIDTGADASSIDKDLAAHLGDKEIISHKIVKSALGRHRRPTILMDITIDGKKYTKKFSLSDRSTLKYKILIGNDILKEEGFIIDPQKETIFKIQKNN